MTRLQELYKSKIMPELKTELALRNHLAAPRIEKIIINAGIGKLLQSASGGPKNLDKYVEGIAKITGQKPLVTRAAKAISGFKVREGQVVGLAVTLRGKRMYDFLDRLINAALPRSRDFRGVPRSGFDGRGNYSLGVREHVIFPEASDLGIEGTIGLQVTIVTTAKTDEQAHLLLKKLGFPFAGEEEKK